MSIATTPLPDMSLETLAFTAVAFIIAGLVKGLTGLGLPTMSLGLLLLAVKLPDAMVILLVPLFVTNAWQGLMGGHLLHILSRLWPLFLAGVVAIWFAVGVMISTSPVVLTIGLGVVLTSYASYSLLTPQVRAPGQWEVVMSPLAGAVTGIIGGLTGSMAVPSVPYMQALGMKRDALIQAMGIWFCLGSVALSGALGGHNALPPELVIVSVGAVVPAIAGMEIGRRLRQRLSETLFRKVLFTALMVLGVYITGRGLVPA